jgi:hypothetical protein
MKGNEVRCEKAPSIWALIYLDANTPRQPIEMFKPRLETGERFLFFQHDDKLLVAETHESGDTQLGHKGL